MTFGRSLSSAKLFLKNNWSVFFWILTYLFIAGSIHNYISYPWDSDTPFHVVVGRLISEHGMLHSFPWTPFSWIADHYTDDKLLFHLMFVPLAGLDWITATRIVGTLAGVAILTSLYLILKIERVRFAGLWALLPLTGSLLFFFRFILVRPHLLSIALAPVFLWAAVRGRLRVLAVVSIIYPWAYVAFWQMPCLLLFTAEAACFLSGKRLRWEPSAVALAGIVVGIAIHPDAVNLLRYNWIVMYDVLFKNAWLAHVGFDMGTELNPYPLGGWIQGLSASVLMTFAAAVVAWRRRREDITTLAFTLAALGFCILTMRSARFSEYFVPFSVAAMALASRSIRWPYLSPAIVGVTLVYTLLVGTPTLSELAKPVDEMPPETASFLQQQIPRGSQVFTPDWDRTGLLMLTLPDRYFIVALDPTLFYLKAPELYRLWFHLSHDAPSGSAEIIRSRFRARFVIIFKIDRYRRFSYQLSTEPGVRMLLNSKHWVLFDLGTGEAEQSKPPVPET